MSIWHDETVEEELDFNEWHNDLFEMWVVGVAFIFLIAALLGWLLV